MSSRVSPAACDLCGGDRTITAAGFQQLYSQKDSQPVLLDWWECGVCRGWFVSPIPSGETISRHLAGVDYNDPSIVTKIAGGKQLLQLRILRELALWTEPGELLDFGCNFGQFLVLAREAGWKPSGFEPYLAAAEAARAKGFDVRSKWCLEEAAFSEGSFAAITAVDVFCLVWNPIATLRTFHRLLKPGGVLAMRLTNKKFVLELTRSMSPPGRVRDTRLSNTLLGQFHSIGMNSLVEIAHEVGFDRVQIQPRALTAPWKDLSWRTRIAYLVADIIYGLTCTKANLYPGVLFFARKPFDGARLGHDVGGSSYQREAIKVNGTHAPGADPL